MSKFGAHDEILVDFLSDSVSQDTAQPPMKIVDRARWMDCSPIGSLSEPPNLPSKLQCHPRIRLTGRSEDQADGASVEFKRAFPMEETLHQDSVDPFQGGGVARLVQLSSQTHRAPMSATEKSNPAVVNVERMCPMNASDRQAHYQGEYGRTAYHNGSIRSKSARCAERSVMGSM
ncbi:uncharacterized protein LAESUDRAFT_713341 [Laetiporus sulphureus 93-53]|uniref:Uncharacterized protein n=1 Tax=Laetiporus sulphureus 93-53 TaxID=1314785 RepID=A0A165ERG2_9APHY|nr:uncharacterized protein LAESUDRAFT_713341 [Laetiporus sulphureus 93-53]KZT07612.1 hypothetical protein LAESUDRAFT_713341 [Laetiporus sulphureus 93-53]